LPGLTGQPSIPERSALEPIGRGVLDRPFSRAMTVEGAAHVNRDFNPLLAAPSRPNDAST